MKETDGRERTNKLHISKETIMELYDHRVDAQSVEILLAIIATSSSAWEIASLAMGYGLSVGGK